MTIDRQMERSDAEIVRDARRGDRGAFKALYDRNRDRVYNLAFYMLGEPLWAEDVLQTVFLKAYKGLAGFRLDAEFGTWLYRIALNECQNQLRGRRAEFVPLESVLGRSEEVDRSIPLPDSEHQEHQRSEILRQAVMDLTPRLRAVVVMKYFEGLSYDEIARVLAVSSGTVASRLNRALLKMEERLRPLRGLL
jgi:RNA polymerase sigma-70 factor (ECF subfamily)